MKNQKCPVDPSIPCGFSFEKDTDDENADFQKLMKRSGIVPLNEKTHPDTIGTEDPKPSEKVYFQEDTNWSGSIGNVSLNRKFAGIKKLAPQKPSKKRKISREFKPDNSIDLHGETRESAVLKIQHFLQSSKLQKFQTVLIITGKGMNSGEEGGILRQTVWNWLRSYQKVESISFQWAPYFLGGDGAILVFL
ncbi:MAG: Smr/MutS family protein [Proteobacteria bacterium]|nr:Smr/MutS family protein [Pseudomonadota bacterium]